MTAREVKTMKVNVNFNSHAHVERDLVGKFDGEIQLNFNSHAHVERDGDSVDDFNAGLQFQLTRSRGA